MTIARLGTKPPSKEGSSKETAIKLKPSEAQFIEECGVVYEQVGLPRMSGRIIGWLLICEPAHQSLTELGEALQASKGSISTMTRVLLQIGLIKRVSIAGDRRDYVAMPSGGLSQLMRQQISRTVTFRQLAEHGMQAIAGSRPERSGRLRELHDLYSFLEREMPALMNRWERESKKQK